MKFEAGWGRKGTIICYADTSTYSKEIHVPYGLVQLPWWGYVLVVLATTHFTLVATTLYLHRNQTHRAIDLHPAVAHVFRFWLWLTCGVVTREWVAVHRKHHLYADLPGDPHSPMVHGIRRMLRYGYNIYCTAASDRETVQTFGQGTPDDWLERHVYTYNNAGVRLLLVIDLILFGVPGLSVWAVQQLWIPFFAASIINGVGHYWGYRNYDLPNTSTNIIPWGILIAGEELHNNHHAFPTSARFSCRPWEFDIGWLYLRLLTALGLARVIRLAPVPRRRSDKLDIDSDTVRAVIVNRLQIMTDYARSVLGKTYRAELTHLNTADTDTLHAIGDLVRRDPFRADPEARIRMDRALTGNTPLKKIYDLGLRLMALVHEQNTPHDALVEPLRLWHTEAMSTGIPALQDFARILPQYCHT